MISFREKSLWVSLLITAVIASVFGNEIYYFLFLSQDTNPQDISALITRLVIAIIILEIALHIALSMDDQEGAEEREDERERNYRLVANNFGYWVLSIGVISCIIHQMMYNVFVFEGKNVHEVFITAPIELKLVVVFWLSEVARFLAEIYYFRKES